MTAISNGRRITTQEAQIKTAAVEVKALTINGKQVTLSVFRQLKNENLLDPDTGELRGVPWGTVNYFWGDCQPNHLHVVWQKGRELRRACLFPPRRENDSALRAMAGYVVLARTLHCDDYRPVWQGGLTELVVDERRIGATFPAVPLVSPLALSPRVDELTRYPERALTVYGHEPIPYREILRQMLPEDWRDRASLIEMEVRLRHLASAANQREDAWRQRYDEIAALDQLFIAV